jgi:GNAT superfamily N-acetyltransferase
VIAAIRAYQPSDWTAVCRIHDAARMDELRLSVGEAAFCALEDSSDTDGLFEGYLNVIVSAGQIHGFAAGSGAELTWLYVDPASYGKGYGRALLRHSIGHAGPAMETQVLEGNTPALNLYLSEGFKLIERKSGNIGDNQSFSAVGLRLERRPAVS